MSKIICVWGATGNQVISIDSGSIRVLTSVPQGGSVIRSILAHPQLSKTYSIRAVTRDPSKPAGVELKKQGVDVVAVRRSLVAHDRS
jgi:hypothetical protein